MVSGVEELWTLFSEMGAPYSGFGTDGSFELPLSHWGRVELLAWCSDSPHEPHRVDLSISYGETRDGVVIDLR